MTLRILHYSDLETALDDPERCGALAGALAARRDADALVVGTGDNTSPGALPLATEGRVALSFFEAVAPDVDTFGNHDFDFGPAVARELAAEAPQTWCCANATVDGDRFAADATEPSVLLETDGHRVGVVGVAHPDTAAINPFAAAVTFHDPVPAVREETARLREAGAEFVVVASHCGQGDARIARETDVDAVLGGHVHDVHVETVADTFVVRPGRAGRYVSEVVLGDGADVTVHEVDGDHPDAALVERLRGELAAHGLDEVVATVADPVERSEETANVAESRVGNLVADALRWGGDADVGITPAGALRSGDPFAGDVTVADLVGLTPYRDDLAVVALSGDRMRAALAELPVGYHHADLPRRFCSHVSGAAVVWDDDAGTLREATVGGDPLDPDRTYRLAVADYLVETDHVSDVYDESDVVERHGRAHDALVAYAREVGIEPRIEGRVSRPALER